MLQARLLPRPKACFILLQIALALTLRMSPVLAQDPLTIDVLVAPGDPPVSPALLQRGSYVQVALRASGAGKLDAWVDFNRDRDADDPVEQIFTSYPIHEGINIASFRVPAEADPGASRALFRFSSAGGLTPTGPSPDGESKPVDVEIVTPGLASDVEAWYAHGQVWVTWRFDEATAPQTFEIYRAQAPFIKVRDAERVGRLFTTEYTGAHIAQEMRDGLGAAAPAQLTVPTDSVGGKKTLQPGQGLFVGTVRESGEWYYAVVPAGLSTVPSQSILAAPVHEVFDSSDPPTSHEQTSGIVDVVRATFFVVWVDGDQDTGAGRSDFPIFANAARRGVPHPFIVMEPIDGVPRGAKAPACLAFHSGDARASMWLPGDKNGFASAGLLPRDSYVIALEDRLWAYTNGIPDHDNTNWLGYVPSFDPFTNVTAYPGSFAAEVINDAGAFPGDGEVIQAYTQDRLLWTLDWLTARLDLDPDRVSILGHSGGAKGALTFSHSRPERISSVVLFAPGLGDINDFAPERRIGGSVQQNLPTTLINREGLPVHKNEIVFLTTSLSPFRDTPYTRIYLGKREENWCMDDDGNFLNDVLEEARRADAAGTGVAFSWDLREHGVHNWSFSAAQERLGADMPADWTPEDYWIPALSTQTRRDDAAYLSRYRRSQSYPAFFHLESYPGHGDPGTVIYDGTVPFDGVQPYDGTVTDEDHFPPFTGDDRGTWGGYFDWRNDESGVDALADTLDAWACTVFLEGNRSPGGYPLSAVDEAPMAELTTDIAIRRPQLFVPEAGSRIEWRVMDRQTNLELQNGDANVDADGLVVLAGIRVLKDPGVRIEVRKAGAEIAGRFRRGDANGDRKVDLSDAVRTLAVLFVDPRTPIACEDAADANDDGAINISDPSFTLNFLFLGGPEPPAPGILGCGFDTTTDALESCKGPEACGA